MMCQLMAEYKECQISAILKFIHTGVNLQVVPICGIYRCAAINFAI